MFYRYRARNTSIQNWVIYHQAQYHWTGEGIKRAVSEDQVRGSSSGRTQVDGTRVTERSIAHRSWRYESDQVVVVMGRLLCLEICQALALAAADSPCPSMRFAVLSRLDVTCRVIHTGS